MKTFFVSALALFLVGCGELAEPMTKAEVDEAITTCLDNMMEPSYHMNLSRQVISITCEDTEMRRWVLSQLEGDTDA